jgi:hypothetical protein
VQEATEQSVKVKVREYNVTIDVPNQLILHDCADWNRVAPSKQFCKHVGKVMRALPKEIAVNILKAITTEREKWVFKPFEQQIET